MSPDRSGIGPDRRAVTGSPAPGSPSRQSHDQQKDRRTAQQDLTPSRACEPSKGPNDERAG